MSLIFKTNSAWCTWLLLKRFAFTQPSSNSFHRYHNISRYIDQFWTTYYVKVSFMGKRKFLKHILTWLSFLNCFIFFAQCWIHGYLLTGFFSKILLAGCSSSTKSYHYYYAWRWHMNRNREKVGIACISIGIHGLLRCAASAVHANMYVPT